MQLPLRLQLKPSRSYFVFLASGHVLAGVAVCLLPVPNLLRLGLLLLLGLCLLRLWHSASRHLPRLLLRHDGKLEIETETGDPVLVKIGRDTVVWACLIVLHLQMGEGPRRSWVLFPDALVGADAHRQLRLWLRWRNSDPKR